MFGCAALGQLALAKATDGVSESALRSYELGERSPKQDALERIAKALDVAPACFDTYGAMVSSTTTNSCTRFSF
ncbi:helix-turn-helix transcriptional regulator [Coprococcus comes]|uniref:helix-turn-helix domain-containing protein n=1 Tax=Coprococcus comes TaxID=410072 RepID=UPI00156E5AF3|nr:helix-turn-helix transcriptional regulator [Coprococcus comes]NSC18392.1 helix-turn-helix transcriptional regulator [Coprococcus comes]NSC30652.1 helix-turn-helix transcriptional regulator [Coprococcus comes]NSC68281.1 helix-turn-helix transcriptional regulator [Coprococcus comes]NSC86676.1 helix-turn-helix transcriptional regulator [Coprococcus comes]